MREIHLDVLLVTSDGDAIVFGRSRCVKRMHGQITQLILFLGKSADIFTPRFICS
jgi:hypothetical protein